MAPKLNVIFIILTLVSQLLSNQIDAENELSPQNQETASNNQPFEAFTGKITRNKVRMRLQPSLDSQILKEFTHDDLLIVVGESDEFYSILPPKDSKAYVFRTFILDNKVEGNKVNVRLEPALESPVIGQLHSGDEIEGSISPLNSKWLEISPPKSTRFYVCKEYVEKIGNPSVMGQIEKRRQEVNELLHRSYQLSQSEMQKDYSNMSIEPSINGFKKIINEYSDFPDQSARAKELLANLQELLLQKKIEYLEAKAATIDAHNNSPSAAGRSQAEATLSPTPIEEDSHFALSAPQEVGLPSWNRLFDPSSMTSKMASWITSEKILYNNWSANHPDPSVETFYQEQLQEISSLTGILEPYSRTVKNKPGDYLLLSTISNLPIAYLYSTSINLQDRIGHVTTVHVLKRNNNNFAFPAYFVISAE